MCIITGEAEVSNTNIFVAKVGNDKQFTVYRNEANISVKKWGDGSLLGTFKPSKPLAMILPVPLYGKGVDSIKMVDMTNYKGMFDELDKVFPDPRSLDDSFGMRGSLKIHTCGPYKYSVVPDINSFDRLKGYTIGDYIVPLLSSRYSKGYAFLVCTLDKSAEYAPIAYVHPCNGKTLFVPTFHEHGNGKEEISTDDWDHKIYSISKDTNTSLTDGRVIKNSKIFTSNSKPNIEKTPFKNLDWKHLQRRVIKGLNFNGDIMLQI